jgi:cellulose synthase/poly-beta-1,6-N-acetylglucosamine synthase-like glycosyltransferase
MILELVVDALEIFLVLGAGLLLIPCAFLLLECAAASPRLDANSQPQENFPRTTVLIPARDEEFGIAKTIASVRAAQFPRMDILVVADNCADATAERARANNVPVIERNDAAHLGKGFALAFGVEFLKQNPPEVLIVVDADSFVDRTALARLAQCAHASARPAQAANRWLEARAASSTLAISNFAFLVKNIVRPMGLQRMGAPCLLQGNGMAFPWSVLVSAPLATGHLSEDLWWSVQLMCAGHAPLFCPAANVYSGAPHRATVMKTQRARWERGHLETMVTGIPKLLRTALALRRVEPLWLALELSVPPLALLILALAGFGCIGFVGAWFGFTWTLCLLAMVNFILVLLAVLIAWWKFGRAQISPRTLLAASWYVVWKIPVYCRALFGKRVEWTRTERDVATPSRE